MKKVNKKSNPKFSLFSSPRIWDQNEWQMKVYDFSLLVELSIHLNLEIWGVKGEYYNNKIIGIYDVAYILKHICWFEKDV